MSETHPETPATPVPETPAAAAPAPEEHESLAQRLAELEARAHAAEQRAEELVSELKAKAEEIADMVITSLPAHFLHLANGHVVESEGAIPTHVDTGTADTPNVVPVVHAFER